MEARHDLRKTAGNFFIRRVKTNQKESKCTDRSHSRGFKSPELIQKVKKGRYQPHQRPIKRRNDSVDYSRFSELESQKTQLNSSLPLFEDFSLKFTDKSMQLSKGKKYNLKKLVKNSPKRRISPYEHNGSMVLIKDKNYKQGFRGKIKVTAELGALQSYLVEFQEKSKLLLKQLERNVLGH